jgi:glutamate-1-semialdehyde 2,1-aminomutase
MPYPCYVKSAEGSRLTDVDDREIIDFCFNATALAIGHAHPHVVQAVTAQLPKGSAVFAPTEVELHLAREICARLPSAERVFFVNSGGEAVMMALRLARAFTGRPLIAKFEGSFHGNYDDVLWSVSPGRDVTGPAHAPTPVPLSAGLLPCDDRVLILPYNDTAAATELIRAHATELAAIIVEPLANRMGLVLPVPRFLERLRELCDEQHIVLIFDEILSFRAAYRGMQGLLKVTPDVTTLGKTIGGGFPVGGVAGRAEVMALVDPLRRGRVYHTGTFAANPVTMTAGKATLEVLTPDVFDELNARGEELLRDLRQICRGLPLQVTGLGSLFKISATSSTLTNYRSSLTVDLAWQELASLELLNQGFFLTPQLSGCIATTTTPAQIDAFLGAFERLVRRGAASEDGR